MRQKELYAAPETEVQELVSEGFICASTTARGTSIDSLNEVNISGDEDW